MITREGLSVKAGGVASALPGFLDRLTPGGDVLM